MNLCPYLPVTGKTYSSVYYRYQNILAMALVILPCDKTGMGAWVNLKRTWSRGWPSQSIALVSSLPSRALGHPSRESLPSQLQFAMGVKLGPGGLGIFSGYSFSLSFFSLLFPFTFHTIRGLPTLLVLTGTFLNKDILGYTVWNTIYIYQVHIMVFCTISLLRKYILGIIFLAILTVDDTGMLVSQIRPK